MSKFKLGDSVEIIGHPNYDKHWTLDYKGKIFEVVKVNICTFGCNYNLRNGNPLHDIVIHEDHLKLVEPVKVSPKSLLKDGMRVENEWGKRIVIGNCYYGTIYHNPLDNYDDNLDLTSSSYEDVKKQLRINAIYEPPNSLNDFLNPDKHGKLIWQRESEAVIAAKKKLEIARKIFTGAQEGLAAAEKELAECTR